MKIWIYPYPKKDKKKEYEQIYLDTSDRRYVVEALTRVLKDIDMYHKIKIEILNDGEA